MPSQWEWAALAAAAVGAVLWPRLHARVPRGLRVAIERLAGPVVCVAASAATWLTWLELAPSLAPAGADYEGYYLSALAFETDQFHLYARDRYPGYPWLASLLARSGHQVHLAGAMLNMGALCLSTAAIYSLVRTMAGRGAAFVAVLLALRLSVVLDLGRTFTHYPLAAALDLGLLAAAVHLVRTRHLRWAGAIGLLSAAAASTDPKQAVVVLAVGLTATVSVLRAPATRGLRAVAVGSLWLPLELLNQAVARLPVQLYTLEEVSTRVQLHFTVHPDLLAHAADGFRLGEPGAWLEVLGSLWRTSRGITPEAGQEGLFSPLALEGLQLVYGTTSAFWLGGWLLLVGLVFVPRTDRTLSLGGPLDRAMVAALLLLPAAVAWPNLHLHYQHRYVIFPAVAAVVLAIAGLGRAAPGAGLFAGVVAVIWPGSPWQGVDLDYLERENRRADLWAGPEAVVDLQTLSWAQANLPANAHVFDMAEFRAMPTLAAAFPYQRCNTQHDACAEAMANADGPLVANVWTRENLSARLPSGPQGTLPGSDQPGGGLPGVLGSCWSLVLDITPDNGLYVWSCPDARPKPSRVQVAPPPPPPLPDRSGG